MKKINIKKTTFHGLRDTHASFLFAQDIDIAYVSKQLGHINIQTTQNYYLELMPKKAPARSRCFKSVKFFVMFIQSGLNHLGPKNLCRY
ncbi:tyrosine-type recombinase/integrase [Bacillus sp. PK6-026]